MLVSHALDYWGLDEAALFNRDCREKRGTHRADTMGSYPVLPATITNDSCSMANMPVLLNLIAVCMLAATDGHTLQQTAAAVRCTLFLCASVYS